MSSQATTDETSHLPSGSRASAAWACLVIFLLAFGLRWTHQRAAAKTVYPGQLGFLEDARYYASWSQQIAAGDLVGQHSFFMGPLYPYSLALIQPLGEGDSANTGNEPASWDFSHAYLVQAIFGALSCVLIFGITKHLLGTWQAWLAGILAACQRVFIYYDGLLMPSSQALFVILAAIALIFVAQKSQRPVLWWLCGIALGLAVLAKAPSLLLLGGVALWLLGAQRDQALCLRLRQLGLMLLGALPIIGLATVHNYVADGDLVLVTSNAGANLWIGNGPSASGAHAGVTTRFKSAKLDFYRFGHERPADEPAASGVSRELSRQAWRSMASNPAATLALFWKKFRMFWSSVEIGTSDQFEFFKRFSLLLRLPIPGVGWIAPLGLLGFVITLGRWRKFWPLHLLVSTQAASFTLFFMLGRYRLASIACLIVFAVAALDWIRSKLREQQRAALLRAALGLVLAICWVHWPIAGMGPERGFANQYYLLARYTEEHGDDPMPSYLQALDSEWREGDLSLRQEAVTHMRVADAQLAVRRRKRARTQYKRALATCDRMSPQFRYRQPLIEEIELHMQALGEQ